MHSFKDYLKEEVMPTVLSNGSIDIANESVRDEINGYLSAVATRPCVTPYIALNKMRKLLAYFHIYLPKRAYMEGRHGVEVWGINQFGDKMGMTDQGEFVKSVPAKFHLFFHYHLVGSHYFIDAKIVNDEELEDKVSTTERMFAEGHDAACQQSMSKAVAPKEAIKHTDDSTESTKKAVATSQRKSDKKLSADKLDEVSLGKLVAYKRGAEKSHGDATWETKFTKSMGDDASPSKALARKREKGVELADKKMKGKAKVNASAPKHPYMEESLDETRMPASVIKHKQKIANMTPEEKAKKFAGKSEEQLKSMARRHGYGKDSNEYSKTVKEEQIDEIKQSKEKRYGDIIKAFKTAPGQVGGQSTRERDAAITKHMGGDVHKGEIRRAMKRHFHTKGLMEDEQIDELKQQTLKAYKSAAKADRNMSKKVVEKGLDTDGKFKHAIKKRKQGIERASDRLEEKAPPGAKFERMVKHIKKGYSKDGLTAKEKSIAYATAWKAKKKESD